jgi:hypothetical protein
VAGIGGVGAVAVGAARVPRLEFLPVDPLLDVDCSARTHRAGGFAEGAPGLGFGPRMGIIAIRRDEVGVGRQG